MRSQLEPLLGQRVRVSGYTANWKENGMVLINLKVTPYRSDNPPIDVDHLWSWGFPVAKNFQAIEKSCGEKVERFMQLLAIARIERYTRKNGTQDYGIKAIPSPSIDLDSVWDLMEKRATSLDAIKTIYEVKAAFDEDMLAFNPEFPYSEVEKPLNYYYEFAVRSYQAQQERLANQVRYEVRRDRPLPSRKLKPVQGFAIKGA